MATLVDGHPRTLVFLAAVLLFTNVGFDAAELNPSIYPLSWPTLPSVPAAAILLAGCAGFLAPPPVPPGGARTTLSSATPVRAPAPRPEPTQKAGAK